MIGTEVPSRRASLDAAIGFSSPFGAEFLRYIPLEGGAAGRRSVANMGWSFTLSSVGVRLRGLQVHPKASSFPGEGL
jgi:hypothetical protein